VLQEKHLKAKPHFHELQCTDVSLRPPI
jgi:hypothetical protein